MMKATALRFQPGALLDGTALQLGVTAVDYLIISAGVAVLLTVEFLQERGLSIRKRWRRSALLYSISAY